MEKNAKDFGWFFLKVFLSMVLVGLVCDVIAMIFSTKTYAAQLRSFVVSPIGTLKAITSGNTGQ